MSGSLSWVDHCILNAGRVCKCDVIAMWVWPAMHFHQITSKIIICSISFDVQCKTLLTAKFSNFGISMNQNFAKSTKNGDQNGFDEALIKNFDSSLRLFV